LGNRWAALENLVKADDMPRPVAGSVHGLIRQARPPAPPTPTPRGLRGAPPPRLRRRRPTSAPRLTVRGVTGDDRIPNLGWWAARPVRISHPAGAIRQSAVSPCGVGGRRWPRFGGLRHAGGGAARHAHFLNGRGSAPPSRGRGPRCQPPRYCTFARVSGADGGDARDSWPPTRHARRGSDTSARLPAAA